MIYTLIRKNNNNVDAVISFDSVTSSDESWSATVTTQTVEKGFNITDNINIEPPTYSIEAVISSYSLFNLDNEIVWDGETFKNSGNFDANSHIVARDEIIRIFTERSVLSLVESSSNSSDENLKKRYEELQAGHYKETDNCVMTSLSISHPDSGTGAFYVSIKLQKIHIALVTVSELPADEVSPLVIPLLVDTKDESNSLKTATGEDGNPLSREDIGFPEEPDERLKVGAGKTQADYLRHRAKKLGEYEDKNYVIEERNRLVALDGIPRIVVGEAGSWSWKYQR